MSIICPQCGVPLNQITNSHIRTKHPEFKSVLEFKEFFKLDSLWSSEVTTNFISKATGKTRGPYNLTEKYFEGVKRATAKRTGEQHWNYGNNWTSEQKKKISLGVKTSPRFQSALLKYNDNAYRSWRRSIIINNVSPRQLKTRVAKGLIIAFENRSPWEQYRILIGRHTKESLKLYRHLIDPTNLLETKLYDLDHQFSKLAGFKNGIPPEIIGSVVNLIPLDRIKNRKKYSSCSITKEELLLRYSEFVASLESTESFKSRKP